MRYLIIILLIYSNDISSQNDYFNIRFENLELLEKKDGKQNFYFEINGRKINPDKQNHKIITSKRKVIDTVTFNFSKDFEKRQISFAKFRKRANYIIKITPCSGYEIFPEIDREIGKVKIRTKLKRSNLKIIFCLEELKFEKENSNKFLKCIPSANCPFSSKKISLHKEDEIVDYFNFHFLHGEKICVRLVNNKMEFKVK